MSCVISKKSSLIDSSRQSKCYQLAIGREWRQFRSNWVAWQFGVNVWGSAAEPRWTICSKSSKRKIKKERKIGHKANHTAVIKKKTQRSSRSSCFMMQCFAVPAFICIHGGIFMQIYSGISALVCESSDFTTSGWKHWLRVLAETLVTAQLLSIDLNRWHSKDRNNNKERQLQDSQEIKPHSNTDWNSFLTVM